MTGGNPDTPRSSEAVTSDSVSNGGDDSDAASAASRATGIRSTGAPTASSGPRVAGGDGEGTGEAQPSSDQAGPDWIGRVIDDRYEVVERLGEGGMGTVFIAEHRKLRKRVALKAILPQFAGDGEIAARFAREAMASARLEHPHVASALDYGTLPEGGAYLVMQLVRGRSLDKVLHERGRQAWAWACGVAAQVADALAAAHAEGIVHRDLKPENIMLEHRNDGTDFVKVLDFGIARVQAEEDGAPEGAAPQRALTRLGTVMGTPGYMSPEQAVGERVDHRTDLYALGVILWEMIAGRSLFEGSNLTEIMTRQLTETPPSVREVCGDASVPPPLEQLIYAMLARAANARPDSASEVRDQLRQLAQAAPGGLTTGFGAFGTESASGSLQVHPTGQATANTMLPSQAAAAPLTGAPQAQAAPYATAPTQLPQSQTGAQPLQAPTAQPVGTVVGQRRPKGLVVAGMRLPIPLVAAGCSVPLAVGGLALALALSVGGTKSEESAQQTQKPAGEMHKKLSEMFERAKPPPPIPPEVEEHIDTMLNASRRRERREAAKWLQDYEPEDRVPEFALAVAKFERSRGCRQMKKNLEEVREVGDERSLPALERIANKPRRGCGFLRTRDCYACVRKPLKEAMAELGGAEAGETD